MTPAQAGGRAPGGGVGAPRHALPRGKEPAGASGLVRRLAGGLAGLPGRGLEEGGRAVSCGAVARHAPSSRGVRGSGGATAPSAPLCLAGATAGGGGGLRRSPGTAAGGGSGGLLLPGQAGMPSRAAARPWGDGASLRRGARVPGKVGSPPGRCWCRWPVGLTWRQPPPRPSRGGGSLPAARGAELRDRFMPLAAAGPCSAAPAALAAVPVVFSCPCA